MAGRDEIVKAASAAIGATSAGVLKAAANINVILLSTLERRGVLSADDVKSLLAVLHNSATATLDGSEVTEEDRTEALYTQLLVDAIRSRLGIRD